MSDFVADSKEVAFIKAAFGARNRLRLVNNYFASQYKSDISPSKAWQHVYQLLLWIDQTTGLAHCYESDKCQPGKRWYARSLAFHDWLARQLSVTPYHLAERIDWLFLRAAEDLAAEVLRRSAKVTKKALEQRKPYDGLGFPMPGDDPELVALIRDALGDHISTEPSSATWAELVRRVRQHLALENKRKNLVGEGFEDVIADVIRRTCPRDDLEVFTRRALNELPGFNRARAGDKPNKVDVAVLRPSMRTLVTAKWSVRADREKQFTTDFSDYISAESDRKPFQYVFVTNEFDPARLVRACEQLTGNALMFSRVVHISTDAIRAAYSDSPAALDEAASIRRVLNHIDQGRLISLERWIVELEHD